MATVLTTFGCLLLMLTPQTSTDSTSLFAWQYYLAKNWTNYKHIKGEILATVDCSPSGYQKAIYLDLTDFKCRPGRTWPAFCFLLVEFSPHFDYSLPSTPLCCAFFFFVKISVVSLNQLIWELLISLWKTLSSMNFPIRTPFIVSYKLDHAVPSFRLKYFKYFISSLDNWSLNK